MGGKTMGLSMRAGRGRLALIPALAGLAGTLASTGSITARADTGPALDVPADQLAAALSCPSSFSNPYQNPVLLVHGTTQTADETWGWNYLKQLPALGFDTCSVTLPDRSLGDMQVSSEYVVYAVRTMALQSFTGQVDLVGHSQGVEELRWAVRWWPDVAASVGRLIGLAGPDHGTTFFTGMCQVPCWASAWQETPNSQFLAALNRVPVAAGIAYSMIYTRTDQFVEPESPDPLGVTPSAGLVSPTSGVGSGTAIAVQDVCPGRVVDHIGMVADAVVYDLVISALDNPAGTADPTSVRLRDCARTTMPGVKRADEVKMDATLYTTTVPNAYQQDRVSAEPPLDAYAQS
ncbi:MAG: esterase/lipase family protein [Candidatus Dormibacteria bacterium]